MPWKLIGAAGLAGVAATGVVVARRRRAQTDYDPDELRDRLHQRLRDAEGHPAPTPGPPEARFAGGGAGKPEG